MINYRFRMKGSENWRAKTKKFVNAIRRDSAAFVEHTGALIIQDLEQATETWNHEVTFEIKKPARVSAASITVSVFTKDEVFRYINDGTKVRHAYMTRDFTPKTTPNSLVSVAGSGHKVWAHKSIEMRPIEARNFYATSSAKQRPAFVAGMQKIYSRLLREFGLR